MIGYAPQAKTRGPWRRLQRRARARAFEHRPLFNGPSRLAISSNAALAADRMGRLTREHVGAADDGGRQSPFRPCDDGCWGWCTCAEERWRRRLAAALAEPLADDVLVQSAIVAAA